MDQAQRSAATTAVVLLAIATGAVLYYCVSTPGRRQWRALGPTRRPLFVVLLIGWVSWVASTKVVRPWVATIGLHGNWVLDVAPSLIAGVTVTAFAAFWLPVTRQRVALRAFLYGAAITLLLEVVQIWMPKYVFDPFDVLAGVLGAALMSTSLYLVTTGAHADGEE